MDSSIVDSLLATGVRIQQRHLNGFGRNSLIFFFFLSQLCSALFLVGNNPTVRFSSHRILNQVQKSICFSISACVCVEWVSLPHLCMCKKWRKWTAFCCLCVWRRNWPIICYIFTTSHVLLLCLSSQVTPPAPQTKEEREKWADILRHTQSEKRRERKHIFVCYFQLEKIKEKT